MDQADKRRQEIAAKKAKLEALRQQRLDRQQAATSLPPRTAGTPNAETRAQERKQIDELVNALVGDAASRRSSRPNTAVPQPMATATVQTGHEPTLERTALAANEPERHHAPVPAPVAEPSMSPPVQQKRETITYTRGTQTQDDALESNDEEGEAEKERATVAQDEQATLEAQEELIAKLRDEIRAELTAKDEEERQRRHAEEPPPTSAPVTTSQALVRDYLADDVDVDLDTQDKQRLRLVVQCTSEQAAHRSITYCHFSLRFPELVLVAYSRNPLAPGEPDGLVQIYNTQSPALPVFTLTAGSEVRVAEFSPFHPQLIFGGCYSGQVMVWDTRSPGLPVLKSPQTAGRGHSHPVVAMRLVGTKNAHSLVSCAADGTVCVWSLDLLAKPQEFLQLRTLPPAKLDDLAPTGLAIPAADSTSFLVSTEEGTLLRVHRQDRADVKAGVDPRVVFKGHTAAITALDQHPGGRAGATQGGVGDWVLSSALDWSVKLWRTGTPSRSAVTAAAQATSTTASGNSYAMAQYGDTTTASPVVLDPALDFQADDPVYDVQWAPHKAGVFAQVDGGGSVQVWDLTQSIEVPVARATPTSAVAGQVRALNRVAWDQESGKRLAVGGLDGVLSVFEVGERLAGTATQDDWSALAALVQRMH